MKKIKKHLTSPTLAKRKIKKQPARELLKLFLTDNDAVGVKYGQQIKLLSSNKKFEEAILELRQQLRNIREEYQKNLFEFAHFLGTDVLMMNDATRQNYLRTLYERKQSEVINIRGNKKLSTEAVKIAKMFKLYPAEEWSWIIEELILANDFDIPKILIQTNPWFKKASEYGFGAFYNCYPSIKINHITKEKELVLKIYPDTSLGDIKKSWNYVKKLQGILKKELKVKQWYPLKNLDKWKLLAQLDGKPGSDYEKQEKLFGEVNDVNFGPIENRRRNQTKQIRHQYKKRMI